MTPAQFIAKWRTVELKERSASQEHFIDLCRILGEPTPAAADPIGENYCFERGARKDSGGNGWADVWKRHHFAWEYKGKHANLDTAFRQLRQYALALENPPLLVVSDMARFRIHTNWTNSVSEVHEFLLDDLIEPQTRNKLKWVMSDPERLRPGVTRQSLTVRAAETFAELAQSLRERYDPEPVAHFVNRLIFCMFAEDAGLLPNDLFTRMLDHSRSKPWEFAGMACDLFGAMSTGGRVGFESVDWFNGGLFDDDTTLAMTKDEIEIALGASSLDWSEIDPSIMGTLFERGLDPDKRSQLGAHYTDRDKIMRIVEPVVVKPLLEAWATEKWRIEDSLARADAAKSQGVETRHRREANRILAAFLERLRDFTVLDPACGSGNFLYLALLSLKDIEHRVQIEAEALGLPRAFPSVGPANVRGIEVNPYAAELARVSVWIGQTQWMLRNGFGTSKPILSPLDTIECRDAILGPGGEDSDWPSSDVVIGNPPFLGGKLLVRRLGEEYVNDLFDTFRERVPQEADLVTYWFVKAGEHIADRLQLRLDGSQVDAIHTDLTGRLGERGLDLTAVKRLAQNAGVAFMGDTKGGSFDVSGDLARAWLRFPANPNGRLNADVLKPWANGMDVTRRPRGKWIVDFGWKMSETEAALFERPFQHVHKFVRPKRAGNRRKSYRENWWRHVEPRQGMWANLRGLARYIATPAVAKHRLFVWMDSRVCPDHALIVIARDDDVTFGILHSRFHEAWSLRLGTSLGKGNDPRYTPTTTFETFPFPAGLAPDIPPTEYERDPRAISIAAAAKRLVERRDRWLNPPEWVQWIEPAPGFPVHPTPHNDEAAAHLKSRTLTELYNDCPRWLADAHDELDAAVAAAYGWDETIADSDAVAELLDLATAMQE